MQTAGQNLRQTCDNTLLRKTDISQNGISFRTVIDLDYSNRAVAIGRCNGCDIEAAALFSKASILLNSYTSLIYMEATDSRKYAIRRTLHQVQVLCLLVPRVFRVISLSITKQSSLASFFSRVEKGMLIFLSFMCTCTCDIFVVHCKCLYFVNTH